MKPRNHRCKLRNPQCTSYRSYAGYQWHAHYYNPIGSTVVRVCLDAALAGIDAGSDRWALLCDDHSSLLNGRSQAYLHEHYDSDWCDICEGRVRVSPEL